jgi:hypothetical protein
LCSGLGQRGIYRLKQEHAMKWNNKFELLLPPFSMTYGKSLSVCLAVCKSVCIALRCMLKSYTKC